jgi:hypothetical protein
LTLNLLVWTFWLGYVFSNCLSTESKNSENSENRLFDIPIQYLLPSTKDYRNIEYFLPYRKLFVLYFRKKSLNLGFCFKVYKNPKLSPHHGLFKNTLTYDYFVLLYFLRKSSNLCYCLMSDPFIIKKPKLNLSMARLRTPWFLKFCKKFVLYLL